ncbi:MAG: S1C family serine protease [Patescibacteria group bacterium]
MKNSLFLTVVISLVVGFLSGIIGYSLFGLNNVGWPLFGRLNFSDLNSNQRIVIDQPRNVVVEQDLQLKQVENDFLPTLINIYPIKSGSGVLAKAYLPTEILGQGFVLTADGWVVTTKETIANLKGKYLAIGYQSKKYQLESFIIDEATGLVFGKMSASGLTVAKIGRSQELISGQTLVLASQRSKISLVHVRSIGYNFKSVPEAVQSSEDFGKELFLDEDLTEKENNGAVVVNLKGEIVGLVAGQRVVLADYFKNIISQVLDKQKISRPTLGLKYFDLSQTEGLVEFGEKGALVYGSPAKDSAAFGKIQDGDLIKKVNDTELNASQSLSEIINGYQPGNKVELLVKRGEKEESVEVVLK